MRASRVRPSRLFVAVLAVLAACDRTPRPMVEESRSVPLPQDGKVAVELALVGGHLRLEPLAADSKSLCEAVFRFDVEEMRPALEYRPTEDVPGMGSLRASHAPWKASFGRSRNEWLLAVSTEREIVLDVSQKTGICELDLAGLAISKVVARVEQGQLALDFAGAPLRRGCEVEADVGTGQLRVRFPRDGAVRVRARNAVGEIVVDGLRPTAPGAWTSEGFDAATVRLDLVLGAGLGEVVVEPGP